jgi:hypothetical protein
VRSVRAGQGATLSPSLPGRPLPFGEKLKRAPPPYLFAGRVVSTQ